MSLPGPLADRMERVRAARGTHAAAAPAPVAVRGGDQCDLTRGVRNYVPRSGAGEEPGDGARGPLTAVPKAPSTASSAAGGRAGVYLELSRTRKWLDMLSDWAKWRAVHAATVKARCRKGIPDAVRGAAWAALLRLPARKAAGPGSYARLLDTFDVEHGAGDARSGSGAADAASSRLVPDSLVATIERDIHRTYPHFALFSTTGSVGQTALFRVLIAYAQADPTVGYCQGMGFIAAVLLSYLAEEDAFLALQAMMNEPPAQLRDVFAPGMPRVPVLHHVLQGLIDAKMPAVARRLADLGVHPSMWATQWVLTLYAYSFPFGVVVRVWDAFLNEGWKVVYRVALAALQIASADILASGDFEAVMRVFKEIPGRCVPDALLDAAFAIRLRKADIAALEATSR